MIATTTIDGFYLYWELGRGRNLDELARRYGLFLPVLRLRAANEGWLRRAARLDLEPGLEGEEESMEGRHLQAIQMMKARAIGALARLALRRGVHFRYFPIGTVLVVEFGRKRGKALAKR